MTGTTNAQSKHQSLQKFPFLSVNASPSRDNRDEESRKFFVRSYAKRAALEQQGLSAATDSARFTRHTPHAATPLAQHVGKFRLAAPTRRKKRTLKPKPRSQQVVNQKEPEGDAPCSSSSTSSTCKIYLPSLPFIPSGGRIDPFSTLPTTFGIQQQKLLYYYKNALTRSFLSFDPNAELISCSVTDPAWLNATFSLVALYYDLSLGKELSLECLFHRGEALRLVNQRLAGGSGQSIDQSTIGAVALLANFDITTGSLNNAVIHMNGLELLVNLQGGLCALKNSLLQNLATWSDLQSSSVWDSQPRFRLICDSPQQGPTPVCIGDLDKYFAHQKSPPGIDVELSEIFRGLHHVSRIKDGTVGEIGCYVQFSSCLYLAEYRLLTISKGPFLQDPFRYRLKPMQLALYLYLHVVLRELPLASNAGQALVKRLKSSLDESHSNLYSLWADSLHSLLWIAFIGAAVAAEHSQREYFVRQTSHVSLLLGITSGVELTATVKKTLWFGKFCNWRCALLWDEVEKQRVTTTFQRRYNYKIDSD